MGYEGVDMNRPRLKRELIRGDCIEVMRTMPDNSVDLVFGSPPYESQRTYGIGFNLKGQDWVDWMVEIYKESIRISKGLVAFVVQGHTCNFRWSATPALLMADLHRAGIHLREGPYYYRSGIPGSGGPDWLRHDLEYIVSATNGGRLPWSDNTACGNDPKFEPGGNCTNRKKDGKRIRVTNCHADKMGVSDRSAGKLQNDGTIVRLSGKVYIPPKKANPGNIIRCSGGHLGNKLAHENEAPFPLKLAEFFVKSFCPVGGVTLDPFCGSGTMCEAAIKNGRGYVGIDVRQSQIELTQRRLGLC